MIGVVGLLVLYGIAFLLSSNRRAVSWRLVAWGIGMQFLLALVILKTEPGRYVFDRMGRGVARLLEFADMGSEFVFGPLADPANFGLIFAFKVLPIIIFISSLFTVLYYLGIMQRIVLLMAKVMHRFMGVSGSESLAAAANVFMGQTEAPIIIAPYIPRMTTSELMALMTGGMATVSGAVLASYAAFGVRPEYLLTASVMAAPASLVLAKLLIPETEESLTAGKVTLDVEAPDVNIIDAAARGAGQGITLALNVGGMLVAFIALIWLLNGILGAVGNSFASVRSFLVMLGLLVAIVAAYLLFWSPTQRQRNLALASSGVALAVAVTTLLIRGLAPIPLELQSILGTLFAPVAFIMGVPWEEAGKVGQLFGIKLMLNEFVAYVEMSDMLQAHALSPKAELIASYALCGFANFSSIGIQIGGIGGLAPTRKSDLARLGLRAVLGGMMASYTVATIAGLLSGL
jgi:CNT family concentrative nucleoside transporter